MHGSSGLRQQMDSVASTLEKFRSMKRATGYKDNDNQSVAMVFGEKVFSAKDGPWQRNSSPELKVRATESFTSRSVVNLSNQTSKVAIYFAYHYSK